MKKYNPKEAAAYSPAEAAHYLRVPPSTLRSWVLGQSNKPKKPFQPVVQIADSGARLLSFNNLVEIHVLSGIRKIHDIPLPKIRKGLRFIESKLGTERPLLNQKFLTNGLDLFVKHSGLLLNITQEGQLMFQETMERFLQRIERDPKGVPIKLYPFSRHAGLEDKKSIVIDPTVAFGRPVIVGTSVPTDVVCGRFFAGEPMEELAQDFNVDTSLIEEAIRCEQGKNSAA